MEFKIIKGGVCVKESVGFAGMTKAIKIVLFIVPFTLLIVLPQTVFPFIVGKFVAFRLLISLATILFGIKMFLGKTDDIGWKNLKTPLFTFILLFIGWLTLTTPLAYDPHLAFFSNFERGEGLIHLFYLLAYFVLISVLFRGSDYEKIIWCFLTTAFLSGIYGLLAAFQVNYFVGPNLTDIKESVRFFGSMGNPVYFGTFLMLNLWFVLTLLREKLDKLKRIAVTLLGLSVIPFLWLSQPRAAFLGFLAGIIVALSYWLYLRYFSVLKFRIVIVFLMLILMAVSLFQIDSFRVFNLNLKSTSFQTRIWIWEAAIKGIKERPIFGWGLENFGAVFDKHYDIRHIQTDSKSPDNWYDRVHSAPLDYVIVGGVPALILWLGIILSAFYIAIKKMPVIPRIISFGFLTSYLVQSLATFDTLPIYLILFFFLAVINHHYAKDYLS